MKNIKKLIIASVLSMITASCYAGSIVVGSEQQSSVDIGFASPQQLSVTFAPVAGLGETTSPKGNVNYNGHQWIIYDINDKLGVKLAGDQNVPADVFPMTVNIAAYQA
ncbi:hypothetical protein FZH65_11185 [Salmonella enterica]|nr:hypothetical protein [Salmonella enterica]EBJ7858243.1 hypothetical protein [Salmonella enterica]EBK9059878.1 hypothetical protein [Salmonella enterica]EBM1620353.1 hypothetical protein [Salmonella enterica]EBM2674688.1 hypothetical protein [Salmonella enterica]